MKTNGDITNEFLMRNGTSTTVGFYTDLMLSNWVNQAHVWAAGYKKWPFTEGRSSTTFASLATNEDGYLSGVYPEGWKSDSIRLLKIGGKQVDKKEFYKFTKFLEDYSGDDSRIFSDFARVYYINPNIDLSGTVTAWGQYTPVAFDYTVSMTLDTVFTGEEEGNEAIVEKMMALARRREKKINEALVHEKEAQRILEELWARVQAEQFAYQTPTGDGMFERFNVIDEGDEISENQF